MPVARLGCGREARLLRAVETCVGKGIGIDRRAPAIVSDKLATVRGDLERPLPFADATFDVVTMLAVLRICGIRSVHPPRSAACCVPQEP